MPALLGTLTKRACANDDLSSVSSTSTQVEVVQHESKSPVLPLLIGAMAAVPGFVTWGFATQESDSFSSDWVLISLPLLLLAAVCLAFAGKRAAGLVGFAGGLIAGLAATAVLFYLLSASIEERQAYHVERERLDDTIAFCDGGARPFPEAPAFAVGARASMLVFSEVGGRVQRIWSTEFLPWSPESPRIDLTALVACVDTVDAEIEVCRYEGGRTMRRVRRDRRVRLFSLQTGATVAEAALPGSRPDACAAIESFYDESSDNVRAGSTPNDESVATFLRGYVAP